mmetsp:Transcript_33692/g.60660  ORF Transcript_33692/g.60660 Transcript_33692/m.60660 type:complete len:624 (+) Transcript_33692:83-1954(+)
MNLGAAKKVEMRERLKNYLEERLNDSSTDFIGSMQDDRREMEWKRKEAGEKLKMNKSKLESSTKKVVANKTGNSDNVSEWKEWQALIDNKRGQIYYYNKNTRKSSWERPDGFPDFKLSASKRVALEEQNKRFLEWHKDAAKVNVLGRGTVVISDSNFDDESEPAMVEAKTADSNELPEPAAQAKKNLPTNNAVIEEVNEGEEKPEVNQPPTLPIVQQGDWSAYFDIKSGVVFYFNEESGETSWDAPFKDFPSIVMENSMPKVLDSGSGNISMERALGYIGVDEMTEALAWEEAKKKERARKAAKRAKEAKIEAEESSANQSEGKTVEMYEAAKKAELERLEQERKLAAELKVREEAAATKLAEDEKSRLESERLKQERIATEEAAAKEREAAITLAVQEKTEQARLEKERLENQRLEKETLEAEEKKLKQERVAAEAVAAKEREAAAKLAIQKKLEQERLEIERVDNERLEAEGKRTFEAELKQPVLPKEDPTFTVESVETMVAPLKTRTLYDILQCSPTASRIELKRSYLSLAKETHPDALLQYGMVSDAETELRFVEISQAWKIVGDSTSRRRYDRELQAKGISSKAGNMFENWVMGAAKAMDGALAKAENDLESEGVKKP